MEAIQFQLFLESLLASLWSIRCLPSDVSHDIWNRRHAECSAKISLAFDIHLITYRQDFLLRDLLTSASVAFQGKPFPCPENAGPTISWYELHRRRPDILQLRDF